MPSEDLVPFSDLANSHPLALNGDDTLIAVAQPDTSTETGYVSQTTTPNQLGAHIIQSQTHAGLKTSSKIVENAINSILDLIAPQFSDSSTYAVDECVIYNGVLYKCTTAVTTAGDFDANDWTSTTIVELL